MKILMLGMLISFAWFAVQSKSYLEKFTQGVPQGMMDMGKLKKTSQQNFNTEELDKAKQVIHRVAEGSEADLAELGLTKDDMSVEVISPALVFKQKMKKAGNKIDETSSQFVKLKNIVFTESREFARRGRHFLSGLLVCIIFLRLIKSWSVLHFVASTFFSLSRLMLLIVSIGALYMAVSDRSNLWNNTALFWLPSGTLMLSVIGLRLYDMNFPIWKRLYGSFILPVLSGICVTGILSVKF